LAEALKVDTAVADVHLDNNSIGDAGCVALTEALKVNTSVTQVKQSTG
jgi:hypothetical protein